MSYAPVISSTLTNGLDAYNNVEDAWTMNAWAGEGDSKIFASEQALSDDHRRSQTELRGSTNGVVSHNNLHTRASTSSLVDSSGRTGLRSRKGSAHRRAATADSSTAASRSGSVVTQVRTHPLQTPKTPTDRSVFSTRPSLKRWLSSDPELETHKDNDLLNTEDNTRNQTKEAEAVVIVHEVTKTDSLAGIALKYGIALADLRRVNHLWASDPIHLRKELYIPIHLTSKKLAIAESQLNGQLIAPLEGASSSTFMENHFNPSVVQRVPLSQLSFFPPPSMPPSAQTHTSPNFTMNGISNYATSPRISRARSSTNSGPSLSSFLQTIQQQFNLPPLPLPLNRPRISLDSLDLSSSTGTNPASEASSDQEHEMDVLGRHRTDSTRARVRGRKSSNGNNGVVTNGYLPPTAPYGSPTRKSKIDVKTYPGLGGKPLQATLQSQLQPPPIESAPLIPVTEQLKPSPRMELPRSSS